MDERLKRIPEPQSSEYILLSIDSVNHRPHPYCITEKHIAYVADHRNGMLTADAIHECEKRGIRCGMYHDSHGRWKNRRTFDFHSQCCVPYEEHKHDTVLFLKTTVNKEIRELENIMEYLKSIQNVLKQEGIDGVAFVKNDKGGK